MSKISELFTSEHGITALYVALLAGAAANAIPDPTDALNFQLDRRWRVKLEKGELTPKQYWERKTFLYYGLDSVWWLFVLLIVILVGKDIRTKAWIAGGLIGGGLVVGMVFNNIKKDEEFFKKYKLVEQ